MKARPSNSYWQRNLVWIRNLLGLWGVIAIGGGVLWVEPLNQLKIGQLPLGFWVSQQGAVVAFVGLVFIYAIAMDRLDAQHANDSHRESIVPDRPFGH